MCLFSEVINAGAFTDTNWGGGGGSPSDVPCLARCLCVCTADNAVCCGNPCRNPGLAAGNSHGVLCWPYSSCNAQGLSVRTTVWYRALPHVKARGRSVRMSALIRDLVPMRGQSVRRGEVDESGCGQVLLGAASNSRASPAGWGKLKQENVFYSRFAAKTHWS